MAEVFISVETKHDLSLATTLKEQLEATNEFTVEVIVRGDHPNREIDELIKRKIISCKYFIPIITEISLSNQWVNQEIGFAVARDKDIWPLYENKILMQINGFLNLRKVFHPKHGFTKFPKDEKLSIDELMDVEINSLKSFMGAADELVEDLLKLESIIILEGVDHAWLKKWLAKGVLFADREHGFLFLDDVIYPIQDAESVNLIKRFTILQAADQYRQLSRHKTGKAIHIRPPQPEPESPFKIQR